MQKLLQQLRLPERAGVQAAAEGRGRRGPEERLGEEGGVVVVGRQLLVRDGVDAGAQELLPDVRVPVVLDLVIRPAVEVRRDRRPLGVSSH